MSQTQQSPEKIWFQKKEYEEAEKQFYENLAQPVKQKRNRDKGKSKKNQVKQVNSPPSALPNKQPQSEVSKPNPQNPPPPAKKPEVQVETPTKSGGGKKSNKKTENKEGEKGSKGKKQVAIEEALPKVESPTSEKTDLPEKIAIPPKKLENEESRNESTPKKPAEVKTKEGPVNSMSPKPTQILYSEVTKLSKSRENKKNASLSSMITSSKLLDASVSDYLDHELPWRSAQAYSTAEAQFYSNKTKRDTIDMTKTSEDRNQVSESGRAVAHDSFRKVWLAKGKYSRAEALFYANKSLDKRDTSEPTSKKPCAKEAPHLLGMEPQPFYFKRIKYAESEKVYYEQQNLAQGVKQSDDNSLKSPVDLPLFNSDENISSKTKKKPLRGKPHDSPVLKAPPSKKPSNKVSEKQMKRFHEFLSNERFWHQKYLYSSCENGHYEKLSLPNVASIKDPQRESRVESHFVKENYMVEGGQGNAKASLASEVAKARQHIKSSLECIDGIAAMAVNNLNVDLTNRVNTLEIENSSLKKQVSDLTGLLNALSLRVSSLEKTPSAAPAPKAPSAQPPKKAAKPDDDDDGVDLFGSDSEEEDDEAKKVREQRLAEYNAKKSKKPVLIAKSNIILDVKPWDDETDMKVMEEKVRTIQTDGLVWGASKLVPLAFGIHKLQISCVVEDDKVSVDWLQENIEAFEDLVQSVDIAAFNKV